MRRRLPSNTRRVDSIATSCPLPGSVCNRRTHTVAACRTRSRAIGAGIRSAAVFDPDRSLVSSAGVVPARSRVSSVITRCTSTAAAADCDPAAAPGMVSRWTRVSAIT